MATVGSALAEREGSFGSTTSPQLTNHNSRQMRRRPRKTEDADIAPDVNYSRPNEPPLLLAWSAGAQ